MKKHEQAASKLSDRVLRETTLPAGLIFGGREVAKLG